ncbi:MAG: glycosyltransferase family 4 protein [Geminicoccaceae bacterium]
MTQLSPSILPALRATPTVYAINTYRLVCPTGLRWTPGEGLCQRPAGEACAMAGCLSRLGAVPRQVQLALVKRFGDSIDRLIAPSSVMANIFAQHGWPCQHVIPHAVPAHRRRQARSDTPLVAFAGRLTQEKGAGWLLKAVAQADAALPGLRVEIIGDGPQRQALERLSGELGLADRVQFLGHLERMASQARLERAWVQVVPSLWPEPFGLVAAEALARGTAVIASDSGGPREIVDHGETGLVVATGDVAALAQALVTLTRDRALALAMGEAGQRVARERYGERAWVEAYLNVYGDMLDARAAARAPDPSLNAQPLAQA